MQVLHPSSPPSSSSHDRLGVITLPTHPLLISTAVVPVCCIRKMLIIFGGLASRSAAKPSTLYYKVPTTIGSKKIMTVPSFLQTLQTFSPV